MKCGFKYLIIILLLFPNVTAGQDKIGFTLQNLTMDGIEVDAIGTIIFNNQLTELEIKQCILPKSGKPIKKPKYKTTKLKLVGTHWEKVKGDLPNVGVELSGTAYDGNDAHFDFSCTLSENECKLILFMTGIEYRGKRITGSKQSAPI